MTRRGHLESVPSRPEWRCQIAAQAIMRGAQDLRVQAVTPKASPSGEGYLCLRVGRVLVYLEDRDALMAWQVALEQAEEHAAAAFGPVMPPPAYRPRTPRPA